MTVRSSGSAYERWGRRVCDVCLSMAALGLLMPLFFVVGLLVIVSMGRPIFYSERRAGLNGVPFRLTKFRTMTGERDAAGRLLPDDRRLTRLGRVLRAWSIDELPELIHVLRGEMSLVGPRPLPLKYVERYTPDQRRRLEVKPGLTGLAQVSGRNASSWDARFRQDVWYVDHRSLRLDLRLLVATFRVVVSREGISHPGHATMHEFRGSR